MSHPLDRTCPITHRLLLVAALAVAGCSGTNPPTADGELDCDPATVWAEEGSVPEGTAGLAGASDAVEAYLAPFLENHGGEIIMVTPVQGSLIVEGSEVVLGEASELPDGGFLVLAGTGCEGFDRSTG
ncbi:MAG: hypothetical protein ACFCU2_09840 [Acidimicrobiia bacterium]